MTYQDTINWMFSQLPMYQKQGKKAYKADLSNTLKLAQHLNFPEKNFKSVHIAGTNGKGSSSHMLASVMQEAGYKVGLYTSPHLKDFRERIRINGQVVSKQFVIGFVKKNRAFFEANQLSFFEMTVGMAFEYFSKQKVDLAVIEVGLGGRLDSTNIITPEVSVITNIGLDHTKILGNTLQAIAVEKGGIIKPNIPVVIGETQTETKTIFKDLAKTNKSKILFADKEINENYKTDYEILENKSSRLVHSPYFKTDIIKLKGNIAKNYSELDSFIIYMCVEGSFTLICNGENLEVSKGETVLLPSAISSCVLNSNQASILEVYY